MSNCPICNKEYDSSRAKFKNDQLICQDCAREEVIAPGNEGESILSNNHNGGIKRWICPECKAEYREGVKVCIDCSCELISAIEKMEMVNKITDEGNRTIRHGISLLFAVFSQWIAAIIAYEFFFQYKLGHGGVSGTAMSNVHPVIWILIIIEIAIAGIVMMSGANRKGPVKE